jgi:hypothetical protein
MGKSKISDYDNFFSPGGIFGMSNSFGVLGGGGGMYDN